MEIINNQFSSIEQVSSELLKNKSYTKDTGNTKSSFKDVLASKLESAQDTGEIRFSKHAIERLASRGIDISDAQLERLNEGTERAKEKGINESLVMIDSLAFIVNTKNNVVITALKQDEGTENIFTNIDGAVIM